MYEINDYKNNIITPIAIRGVFGINYSGNEKDILLEVFLSDEAKEEIYNKFNIKDRNSLSILLHVFMFKNIDCIRSGDILVDIFHDSIQEQYIKEPLSFINEDFKESVFYALKGMGLVKNRYSYDSLKYRYITLYRDEFKCDDVFDTYCDVLGVSRECNEIAIERINVNNVE